MKTVSLLTLLALLGTAFSAKAEDRSVTFYAQLIRGTDQARPEAPHWKPVGPKLSKHLQPVFRWNNYWEIDRQSAEAQRGRAATILLHNERKVEVELVGGEEMEIRLYLQGKLLRKCRQPVHNQRVIMGGARENDESWFVVVRSDKPG